MTRDRTATDESFARAGQRDARVRPRSLPAGGLLRPLLRLRLFYKLIIANVVILLVAVLTGAGLAASAVRVNPHASIAAAVLPVALAAVAVSAIVNALVV